MRTLTLIAALVFVPAAASAQESQWETEHTEMERYDRFWTLETSWVPTAKGQVPVRIHIWPTHNAKRKIKVFDGRAGVDPLHGPSIIDDYEALHIALCGPSSGPAGCSCEIAFDYDGARVDGCWPDGRLDTKMLIAHGATSEELSRWLAKGPSEEASNRSVLLVIAVRDAAKTAIEHGNYLAASRLFDALKNVSWPNVDGGAKFRVSETQTPATFPTDGVPAEALVDLAVMMVSTGFWDTVERWLSEMKRVGIDAASVSRVEKALAD